MQIMMLGDFIVDYAKSFLGTPYKWGGSSPLEGFDCSGFVGEVLKAAGVIGYRDDFSAQGLFNFLRKKGIESKEKGAIAFFGKDIASVIHVAIHIDEERIIEAGGGSSEVTSLEKAIERNAFVKIRPLLYRKDYLTSIKIL